MYVTAINSADLAIIIDILFQRVEWHRHCPALRDFRSHGVASRLPLRQAHQFWKGLDQRREEDLSLLRRPAPGRGPRLAEFHQVRHHPGHHRHVPECRYQ